MSKFGYLQNAGLLNAQADYSELVGVEKTIQVCYCSSHRCAGHKTKVKKFFNQKHDKCPDCGSYLFYKNEPKRNRAK